MDSKPAMKNQSAKGAEVLSIEAIGAIGLQAAEYEQGLELTASI